jgi:hypothetical protein
MTQFAQEDRKTLVATQVDQVTRRELLTLAHREDRSLASVIRRALNRELKRARDETGESDAE